MITLHSALSLFVSFDAFIHDLPKADCFEHIADGQYLHCLQINYQRSLRAVSQCI
jgi:hypothetical protein